jgi:cell division protein FtsX
MKPVAPAEAAAKSDSVHRLRAAGNEFVRRPFLSEGRYLGLAES